MGLRIPPRGWTGANPRSKWTEPAGLKVAVFTRGTLQYGVRVYKKSYPGALGQLLSPSLKTSDSSD